MSDNMTGIPFQRLLNWMMEEYTKRNTVFGIHRPYAAKANDGFHLFGRKLETPIGPAAGPNSQLAQNIAASYYAGSRFFELKTVQILDGAKLAACVRKPCIWAVDECYNCEWSTELTVAQAEEEYIKAWFLLAVLAKEYGLGSMDGYQFNISVGYDLAGIQSQKINDFIEHMKDAETTAIFQQCRQYLLSVVNRFSHLTEEDIKAISPHICSSVTLSTLHGCPPEEIERIAGHLLKEKKMHTFVKCNPTLLGYDFARKTLDDMGYDYVAFGTFHFEDDLQYEDALPMLTRLMQLAKESGLTFGVKITNTFPVDVTNNELPSEEMYMSGKSLYPLSIALAAKLSRDFGGRLRISYSGGADAFNIGKIVSCGVWPVTIATETLKPGGYQRMTQIAEILEDVCVKEYKGTDTDALTGIAADVRTHPHYVKPAKLPVSYKMKEQVPLFGCYTASCQDACPIRQDVPAYVKLAGEGNYEEAMQVIMERNALPFITGTICAHGCMSRCTRNFYETPVQIRDTKLACAKQAYEAALGALKPAADCGQKVAVVGGGPSGMAAAFYLARAGARVTIYEKRTLLGGIVSAVIPDFRIDDRVIAKDAAFLQKLGVELCCGTKAPLVSKLKDMGYDAVILAVGAYERQELLLGGGEVKNALTFLEEFNETKGKVKLGTQVVVIGGGNTAMDAARAAKRCDGVEHVSLVYRRTKRYMPADEHELLLALAEGVVCKELLIPVKWDGRELICKQAKLGSMDASGRAGVIETNEVCRVQADSIIAAIGEKVPADFYIKNGIAVDERGCPKTSSTLETTVPGVYVIGDGLHGPSVVVKGMANAITAAEAILGHPVSVCSEYMDDKEAVYAKKGILREPGGLPEAGRCLSCATVCENCVDVCPNRANISIHVPGMDKEQVIHVDYVCNECGNCQSFCPYDSAPYLDKFTLFASRADMEQSKNDGFYVVSAERSSALCCEVRYLGERCRWTMGKESKLPEEMQKLLETICLDYRYLLLL